MLLGPALAYETASVVARAVRRQASRADLYVLLWAFPAGAIFCTQPLWSDFKPHWALIVWWPFALGLALRASGDEAPKARLRLRVHHAYGWALIALVWASCHVPLGSWLISRYRGGAADPRLDVTNDLYGWPELREWVVSSAGEEALKMPFVGSRYQTAAQAAFALGDGVRFTLLPRDLKARDEWPDLGISDVQGPDWPHLHQPVLYVADNRYDAPPEYPGSTCVQARTFEAKRWGYPAKTIYLWKCVPRSARP